MNKKYLSKIILVVSLFVIVGTMFSLQSCDQNFIEPTEGVAYPDDVSAIFNEPLNASNITCASPSCHGGNNPQNDMNLTDWAETLNGSINGSVVIPYNARWSFFMSVINTDTTDTALVSSVTDVALPEYHKFNLNDATQKAKFMTLYNWINDGAKSRDGGVMFENINRKTFITNQASDLVAVVLNEPDKFLVTRLIPIGVNPNGLESPHYIEVNPQKTHFFISLINNLAGGGFVEKYDVNVDYPFPKSGRVDVGQNPAHIEFSPDGSVGYVTNFNATQGGITKFDANSMNQSSVQTISNERMRGTHGMAIDASGQYLYVTSQVSEFLFKVKTSDFTIEQEIPIDVTVPPNGNGTGLLRPYQIRISPDQQYLYVSFNGPAMDNGNDIVRILRVSDLSFVKDITVGNNPILMRFTPNGQYLFVCNKNKNASGKYTVSIIDPNSQSLIHTVEDVGIQPHGVDFNFGGQYAIISCETLEGFDGHHPTVGSSNIGVTRVIRISDFQLLDTRIQMASFPAGIATYEY